MNHRLYHKQHDVIVTRSLTIPSKWHEFRQHSTSIFPPERRKVSYVVIVSKSQYAEHMPRLGFPTLWQNGEDLPWLGNKFYESLEISNVISVLRKSPSPWRTLRAEQNRERLQEYWHFELFSCSSDDVTSWSNDNREYPSVFYHTCTNRWYKSYIYLCVCYLFM